MMGGRSIYTLGAGSPHFNTCSDFLVLFWTGFWFYNRDVWVHRVLKFSASCWINWTTAPSQRGAINQSTHIKCSVTAEINTGVFNVCVSGTDQEGTT